MNKEFHSFTPEADAAFAEAFPKATDLPWAVGIITGNIKLSPEQALLLLTRCGGLSTGLDFRPQHGHLAVHWFDTTGQDKKSAVFVKIIPATDECDRAVDFVKCANWVESFVDENRESSVTAHLLWCDANGDGATLKSVAELWPWRKCPRVDLEKAGFRLMDLAELDALEIVRRYS